MKVHCLHVKEIKDTKTGRLGTFLFNEFEWL
jgi:hypothetical protein